MSRHVAPVRIGVCLYKIKGWRVKSEDVLSPNGLREEAGRTLKLPWVPIPLFSLHNWTPCRSRLAAIAVAKVTPLRDRVVKIDRDT